MHSIRPGKLIALIKTQIMYAPVQRVRSFTGQAFQLRNWMIPAGTARVWISPGS